MGGVGEYEHILVERKDDTVVITMNRPARRNSLSAGHLADLLAAFTDTARSDASGVVLAGAGPVFSAGHDFADVAARDFGGVRELQREEGGRLTGRGIRAASRPCRT